MTHEELGHQLDLAGSDIDPLLVKSGRDDLRESFREIQRIYRILEEAAKDAAFERTVWKNIKRLEKEEITTSELGIQGRKFLDECVSKHANRFTRCTAKRLSQSSLIRQSRQPVRISSLQILA